MTTTKLDSKQLIFNILRKMKTGREFTGYELAGLLQHTYGVLRYPSTCLNYMREYCELYGVEIVCVNNRKSLYRVEG